MPGLQGRVRRAAEDALARQGSVSFVEVLVGLGWLAGVHVDVWRQGRVAHLQELVQVRPERVEEALRLLAAWARERQLLERDVVPLARGRHNVPTELRFAAGPGLERAIRVCWVRPDLPERDVERAVEGRNAAPDLVVISPLHDGWACHECGGSGDLLLMEGPGPVCLGCADLDHLVFLPAGDATLTRRARKASTLSAVVVRFARARKRYERRGLLVEQQALDAAERACLDDQEVRARRRDRDTERRADHDEQFVRQLGAQITRLFPGCPPARATAIAAWTATRGSGRVGRSAAGRALDPSAVELAVTASIRHQNTDYDTLLMRGVPRDQARDHVRADVQAVLDRWRDVEPGTASTPRT
jgi:hypothetical protein